jgi:hypothetical protein
MNYYYNNSLEKELLFSMGGMQVNALLSKHE